MMVEIRLGRCLRKTSGRHREHEHSQDMSHENLLRLGALYEKQLETRTASCNLELYIRCVIASCLGESVLLSFYSIPSANTRLAA